jgi:hypothetical protein
VYLLTKRRSIVANTIGHEGSSCGSLETARLSVTPAEGKVLLVVIRGLVIHAVPPNRARWGSHRLRAADLAVIAAATS